MFLLYRTQTLCPLHELNQPVVRRKRHDLQRKDKTKLICQTPAVSTSDPTKTKREPTGKTRLLLSDLWMKIRQSGDREERSGRGRKKGKRGRSRRAGTVARISRRTERKLWVCVFEIQLSASPGRHSFSFSRMTMAHMRDRPVSERALADIINTPTYKRTSLRCLRSSKIDQTVLRVR